MNNFKITERSNMSFKNILMSVYVGMLTLLATPANAADIFSDSFESANMGTTNTEGFKWAKNNRTSVVTQDPTDGPVAVYNNGTIYNIHDPIMRDGSDRNWTALTGSHSLRFYYPAGEPWSEQRFDLGTPMKDVWIRYWLRVPTNFSFAPTGSPNKFFLYGQTAIVRKVTAPQYG